MLTPIEIHNKQHKTGRGYSKKEMDEFLETVLDNYETLYKENLEQKEQLTKLSDGIQYYKSLETTLQKALVLAEKTSKETIETANSKAELIEKDAAIKAEQIINQASSKCEQIKQQCISLIQQYNQFKMQFKQIAIKQIDLLDSDYYEIVSTDLTQKINETLDFKTLDFNNYTNLSVPEPTEPVMPAPEQHEKHESLVREQEQVSEPLANHSFEQHESPVHEQEQEHKQEHVSEPLANHSFEQHESLVHEQEQIAEPGIDSLKADTKEIKVKEVVKSLAESNQPADAASAKPFGDSSDEIDNLLKGIKEDLARKISTVNDDAGFEFLDSDD